jgi:hypothetical protein
MAEGHDFLGWQTAEQVSHATCHSHRLFGGKEAALTALPGTGHDNGVTCETGRSQQTDGVAKAGFGQRAVVVETESPVIGCERVSEFLHFFFLLEFLYYVHISPQRYKYNIDYTSRLYIIY